MDAVAPRYQTRAKGLGVITQDSNNLAVKLMARHLQSMMGAPTPVSTDRKVTGLLGYYWVCGPGFTIPKTKLVALSDDEVKAVVRALRCGKLKAAIKTPLCLDEKRTPFAEKLRRDRDRGYENCVYLIRPSRKRRTISSSRWSTNSASPAFRFDGSGDHGPLLDTSGDSATVIHAHLPREHPQDEDTDGTQIIGNDPFGEEAYVSHDLAPIPHGSSASRLTLPKLWATRVGSVEDKAHDSKRKGATVICLTRTGTGLTLKSFRSLLTGRGELEGEIVDACLSMLVRPMDRLEARLKTVLFESTFWQTYQARREHLGRWYGMVAPPQDVEMLLFPIYQDDRWTLFEVSWAEKMIRHYVPDGLNSTDIMERVKTCLETEFVFEFQGWTVDRRPLPQGNSGVLILATAVQRVLRKDVEYSQEDITGLRRWITAILLGMERLTVRSKMVGVGHPGLEDVDIFDLLGLDPFDFSNFKPFDFPEPGLSRVQEVQRLKKGYKRLSLITHPDRKGDIAKFKQLSQLNEYLLRFNTSCPLIWRRIAELFRRGKDGWRGRGRGHVPRPTPASAFAKPGSSPSNPIVIDALEIGAPASLAVDPLNRNGIRAKLCQRHRNRRNRRSSYYPSRASELRPAPYADQSDSDLGWD
ncbi:MAG: hypothetical protein M1840_005519 [Geoglossum simile]|nr:MAG: hypothetical protein M1840_005519 [Geoglossum simile]